VLGALVFVIAIRLIKLRTILALRRESPGEFGLAIFAAVVVVAAGVEQGIVLAMILSLLRIVQHSYDPHTGVMTLSQYGIWQLNPVIPGAVTEPGLVLYRFEAELFYANVNRFSEEVRSLVGQAPASVRWLIVDAESITHLDYSAARVMEQLQQRLMSLGTQLGFARMPFGLKADFARHRLTEVIDPKLIFNRLHEVLAAFEKHHTS
jgi:MFS superfamily sulfate permease-like transporter